MQDDRLAYPTEDTPTTNWEKVKTELITFDLFGQKRRGQKTMGAIQYPVEDRKMGFLTEEMVGPNAQ